MSLRNPAPPPLAKGGGIIQNGLNTKTVTSFINCSVDREIMVVIATVAMGRACAGPVAPRWILLTAHSVSLSLKIDHSTLSLLDQHQRESSQAWWETAWNVPDIFITSNSHIFFSPRKAVHLGNTNMGTGPPDISQSYKYQTHPKGEVREFLSSLLKLLQCSIQLLYL